jgi:hypothetical protein
MALASSTSPVRAGVACIVARLISIANSSSEISVRSPISPVGEAFMLAVSSTTAPLRINHKHRAFRLSFAMRGNQRCHPPCSLAWIAVLREDEMPREVELPGPCQPRQVDVPP